MIPVVDAVMAVLSMAHFDRLLADYTAGCGSCRMHGGMLRRKGVFVRG